MIDIKPFCADDAPSVIDAYTRRLAVLRSELLELPDHATQKDELIQSLIRLCAKNDALTALENDKIVGFLGGYRIEPFKGPTRGVYCPEWAVFASNRHVFTRLYGEMARIWHADGVLNHAIASLAHETEIHQTLSWNEFGVHVIDAIRPTQSDVKGQPNVQIRKATIEDIDIYADLCDRLATHVKTPPISVFIAKPRTKEVYLERLCAKDRHVWLADIEGQTVGFMQCEEDEDGVAYTVQTPQGVAISGAYLLPEFRGKGVAETLLANLLTWAREQGKSVCSVDFESTNAFATGFWLRHFKPVCYSYLRRVDPRTV